MLTHAPSDAVRCFDGDDEMRAYHDSEWGRPVTDERGLYEKICLEAFQSGISWQVVLRKREALRAAFHNFHPDVVARFDPGTVNRLLTDADLIRNRGKIEATVTNARATMALRETGQTLPDLIWSFRPPPHPAPLSRLDIPSATGASARLAAALKHAGFRFVGPTTMYALMQATGMVNDHLVHCWVRTAVEVDQGVFTHRLAVQLQRTNEGIDKDPAG
ncbi:MAG: DNA-3-methyladenine glycosylase I [Chloroflexota bacterium]